MFKKNTAVTGFTFGMVSATDGSDNTTVSPVGYYTLDGGTQTAIGDVTPVHEGNGMWSVDLLAAEMNGDIVGLTFTATGMMTSHFTIKTDTKLTSELNDLATTDAIATVTTVTNMRGTDSAITSLAGIALTADVTALNDFNPATDTVDVGKLSGNATSASNLAASALGLNSTTVATSTSTTVFTLANGETTDDAYNGRVVVFTSGNVSGQAMDILAYSGATKTVTLNATLTATPSVSASLVIV